MTDPSIGPPTLVGPDTISAILQILQTVGNGCIVEVGVYKGGTAYHLNKWAQANGSSCYLYDTFTGIPYADPDDSHKVGDFSDTSFETVSALFPDADDANALPSAGRAVLEM